MFRQHARQHMNCNIVLMHERGGAVEVLTQDVSASGMFVRAPRPQYIDFLANLRIGDRVQARLDSLDQNTKPLSLVVTRLNREGLGLTYAQV